MNDLSMLSTLLLWSFGLRDYSELIFDYEIIELPRHQYLMCINIRSRPVLEIKPNLKRAFFKLGSCCSFSNCSKVLPIVPKEVVLENCYMEHSHIHKYKMTKISTR